MPFAKDNHVIIPTGSTRLSARAMFGVGSSAKIFLDDHVNRDAG